MKIGPKVERIETEFSPEEREDINNIKEGLAMLHKGTSEAVQFILGSTKKWRTAIKSYRLIQLKSTAGKSKKVLKECTEWMNSMTICLSKIFNLIEQSESVDDQSTFIWLRRVQSSFRIGALLHSKVQALGFTETYLTHDFHTSTVSFDINIIDSMYSVSVDPEYGILLTKWYKDVEEEWEKTYEDVDKVMQEIKGLLPSGG